MRRFRPSLVAGAIALALCTGTASAQFTNVVYFGDSLTDSGYFKPVVPPGTGLFTTNPGPVWSQLFSEHFGTLAIPSNQPGGTNYAQGGAQTTILPGIPPEAPTVASTPIATQVLNFLAKGPADPNAIYSVFGGGNDFFWQLGLLQAGATTPAAVQASLGQSGIDLGKQVAILHAGGAGVVMIWNLPDLGRTPYAVSSGFAPTISALVSYFNGNLQATLNTVGGNTLRLNTFALYNEILANPALYGITNTTSPACTVSTAYLCTPSTLVSPNAPLTYLFSNDVHPTTAGHKFFAEYALSFIEGPEQMAALGDAPMGVERASWRAIDGRMMSGIGQAATSTSARKFQAWASYDYAGEDITGTALSTSGNINTVAVGGDMRVSDHLLAGIAFNYSEYKGDFSNSGGSFKLKEPMMTMYVGYGDGPWYVGGTLGAGNLDYSSVQRNITLGAATRTESGNTSGWQTVARVLGGYWFRQGEWEHGPFGKLTWDKVVVHQFSESGSDSTALTYGQQENEALVSSIGWQVTGNLSGWRPFARATWEYNFKNDARDITASPVVLGGTYTLPVSKQDESYALFDLGLTKDFGGVTGYISGNASAGKSNGDFWAVTVGFRVPI
jgi:outer membrane lipase/esterase